MAAKNKTTETTVDVMEFVDSFVENEQKRADTLQLIRLMKKWAGSDPKMWGPTIIGFGRYHYKYASGHEGDAPIIGFSPRKAAFSLYVFVPGEDNEKMLDQLGKFTMGKSCIYVKKLADINISVLEELSKTAIKYHQRGAAINCTK